MLPFYTHTIQFVRAPIVADAHGNRSADTRDWANAEPVGGPVRGCVQFNARLTGLGTREDTTNGREMVEDSVWAWVDPGPTILSTDGFQVDDTLYKIAGEPREMADPFGGAAHMMLVGTRVRG
ncbi:hypothetical protein [Allonocardiopsis opalescens]|uniref:Head-to-tail stopper n=1 Tax=Allonocardiopsis opalescens TaxID=1144618 RepID=A0A2T0PSW1_9ACTN|nr:hypothetical protein [Allonocardiopsis opalescens]PRX91982.1 hypothetical protein CLV72_11255 [Allonocardiopsis opalescens]